MGRVDISFRVATVSGSFRRGGFSFGVAATVLALAALSPAPAAAILAEQKLLVEIGDGDQFVMLNMEQREAMAEIIVEAEDLEDLDLQAVLGSIIMDKPDEPSAGADQDKDTGSNSPTAGAQSGSADTGGTAAITTAAAGAGNADQASTSPAPSPAPAAKVETAAKPAAKQTGKKSTKPAAKAAG